MCSNIYMFSISHINKREDLIIKFHVALHFLWCFIAPPEGLVPFPKLCRTRNFVSAACSGPSFKCVSHFRKEWIGRLISMPTHLDAIVERFIFDSLHKCESCSGNDLGARFTTPFRNTWGAPTADILASSISWNRRVSHGRTTFMTIYSSVCRTKFQPTPIHSIRCLSFRSN